MLNGSIEDNVLTAIVWNDNLAGELIQKLGGPNEFSTDAYRVIAREAFKFYHEHKRPARVHVGDMLEQEIKRGPNGRFLQEIIGEMERLAPLLDEDFVRCKLDVFLDNQTMTRAVNQASDLLLKYENEEARVLLREASYIRHDETILPDPWSEPKPPPFDIDLLPKVLKNYVKERAQTTGFDPAAIFWSALSCCSAAVDGSRRLQMKAHDPSFTVPPSIWVLLFGDASIGRSPILKMTWAPLWRLEHQANSAHDTEMARYNALPKAERGPKPFASRYVTVNTTVEALRPILTRQNRGIAILRDEWSGFIGSLDQYSGKRGPSADRPFYLQAYDGNPYIFDRAGEGNSYIENLLTTLCGGIQPERLRKLGELTDDGLLQRCVTLVMRATAGGEDEPGCREVAAYEMLVEDLAAMPGGQVVQLSREARAIRMGIEEYVKSFTSNTALDLPFRTFVGKLHGLWGRVTLVLGHVLHQQHNLGILGPHEIQAEAAEIAEELIRHQVLVHGARFYNWLGGGSANVAITQAICGWLLAHPRARITASDLTNNIRACHNMKARDMTDAVSPVVNLGWLEPEHPGQMNQRSWKVNQRIYTLFPEQGDRVRVANAQYQALLTGQFTARRPKGEAAPPDMAQASASAPTEEATVDDAAISATAAEPPAQPSSDQEPMGQRANNVVRINEAYCRNRQATLAQRERRYASGDE